MTTYKELIATIKAELKADVASLRAYQNACRQKKTNPEIEIPRCTFDSWSWRTKHIAYCLLKGRTIEQIEPNRRSDKRDEHKQADYYAQRQLAEWKELIAEDIAAWEEKKRFRAEVKTFQQDLSTQILLDMQEGK